MRLSALIMLSVLACIAGNGLSGCKSRATPPPPAPVAPPEPVKPVSGWTTEVTTGAVSTLCEALTSDGWVSRFREGNSRMPVIAVAPFEDRSGDQVPVSEVAAEFVRLLGTNDRVLAASAGQVADVTLSGVIGLRTSADGAKDFTIDARITDAKSTETLWVAGVTRQRPVQASAGAAGAGEATTAPAAAVSPETSAPAPAGK